MLQLSKETKYIIILCCLILATTELVSGQSLYPFSKGQVRHRLSASYVQSFYKNDPNLSTGTKAKPGFNAAYKAEFLFGRKLNFIMGLDYLYQQLVFHGYYEQPGYTYVFDKTFPYSHEVQIQELQLPIGIKESFVDEKAFEYTPYFIGGLAFRYLQKTYTVITNDSTGYTVFDNKKTSVSFENTKPSAKINTCLYVGLGFQKNNQENARAVFIEIMYRYGISRFYYTGYNNSNSLKINNNSIAITLGVRI